jgi:transcriptional antiterminator RfaH
LKAKLYLPFNIEQTYFTLKTIQKQGYNVGMPEAQIFKNDSSWWVVQTKPQAELSAIKNLENQGLTTYCPLFKKENIRGHKIKIHTYPLFPRYVFVKEDFSAQKNIHLIRSTIGVKELLKTGEVPAKISCQLMDELKQLEEKRLNETTSHFKPGENVSIKTGIYKDIEAIYQMDEGVNRSIVLLSIINKETPLTIDKKALNKI